MKYLAWHKWPLVIKLSVSMTALVVLAIVFFTMRSVWREQNNFQAELEEQARIILEPLERSVVNPLLRLDVDSVGQLIENFGATKSGLTVQIYDQDGRLIADTTVDGNPLVFSTQVDPFGRRLLGAEETIFEWHDDYLLAGQGIITGSQRPGAVSIVMPTSALQAKQASVRNQGILVALVALVIGVLLSWLLSRSITEPISQLTKATERLAAGDLSQRVIAGGQDEIATLARSFNKMADTLQETITNLEKQAVELRLANQRALDASRVKSEFLATMSHELRTPLNAILGFSGLLLMGIGGEIAESARDRIERIESNGQHLLSLINNILDIAKIEAGRMEIVPKVHELSKLVEDWRGRIAILAESKSLTLDFKINESMPPTLYVDKERLSQIASNLLSNAVKFTDVGKVSLDIRKDGDFWLLQVSDTGVGIPAEAQEYIFDEFRQVDGSYTRVHGGTGLGLSIVQKLTQAMGGTVRLTSKLGEGSTFLVRLPLQEAPETVAPK